MTGDAASIAAPGKKWVRVGAPVRAFDAGGWSDTWFAGHGSVCNLALQPGATAEARVVEYRPGPVEAVLRVPDFQDHYSFDPGAPPGRHPLLEAVVRRAAPPDCSLDLKVSSPVPAGSSLGTSAAVVVALLGALTALGADGLSPLDLARSAHQVETVDLERQSGVQDQAASAFGGANLVEIGPYPDFRVTTIPLLPKVLAALDEQMVTLYLGRSHDSSSLHQGVIAGLEADPELLDRTMAPIRRAARRAADALSQEDLAEYGAAMSDATAAQAALHPELVGPTARQVIGVARDLAAFGWKVNGAGGHGGSVSVLCAPGTRPALIEAVQGIPAVRVLGLRPSPLGVHIQGSSWD